MNEEKGKRVKTMRNSKKGFWLVIGLLAVFVLATGCTSNQTSENASKNDLEATEETIKIGVL